MFIRDRREVKVEIESFGFENLPVCRGLLDGSTNTGSVPIFFPMRNQASALFVVCLLFPQK